MTAAQAFVLSRASKGQRQHDRQKDRQKSEGMIADPESILETPSTAIPSPLGLLPANSASLYVPQPGGPSADDKALRAGGKNNPFSARHSAQAWGTRVHRETFAGPRTAPSAAEPRGPPSRPSAMAQPRNNPRPRPLHGFCTGAGSEKQSPCWSPHNATDPDAVARGSGTPQMRARKQ